MIAAIDTYLQGPTLRGKPALELLHLPDPTKSKEERDQYRRYVLPLATASILAMAGPVGIVDVDYCCIHYYDNTHKINLRPFCPSCIISYMVLMFG